MLLPSTKWAKHTFGGRCDFTLMVCSSFGGYSTPQFLQCGVLHTPLVNNILATRYPGSAAGSSIAKMFHSLTFVIKNTT